MAVVKPAVLGSGVVNMDFGAAVYAPAINSCRLQPKSMVDFAAAKK